MLKYSIIIPVFGCEKYLQSCIETVLNQTYKGSFEVILVDDGSLDKSGELADYLGEMYAQVRVFHKKNGGAASARNLGIQVATGEYVLFIDGDDMVDERLLESVDALLEKDRQAMVVFGMSFDYYRNEKLDYSEKLSCSHKGFYLLEQVLTEFQSFFIDNALSSACNKVFSSEIIKRENLKFHEEMNLYEDYDFVLQYLGHVNSIICLDSPFYHYRNNLEDVHINNRISDLRKLRKNLSNLLETAFDLCRLKSNPGITRQIFNISVDLYMQLLMQNLMINKYSISELHSFLPEYCSETNFRMMLSLGAQMSDYEAMLLCQIDNGEFVIIKYEFCKKRVISKLKKFIKTVLKWSSLRI